MPGISALRSAIPFHKGTGVVWIDADIVSASVEYAEPTKVLINFSYNLDATSTPAPSAFTLAGKTITDVTVGGGQIVLTVSVAYEYGDIITVDYTVPATNRLKQNITGYVLNSWTGQAVANYVNEEDVATYVDGLATPLSDTQLGYINTFLTNYKSDEGLTNLSDAYDVMYYLGNETAESSLRNMVKRAHDATAVNAPTFTAYEGFAGDGISSYITSNYNPNSQGVNFVLNSASYGCYSRSNLNPASTVEMGSMAGLQSWMAIRRSGIFYYHLNQVSYSSVANSSSLGMFIGARTASNAISGIINGDSKETETDASTSIANADIFILAGNNGIAAAAFSNFQLSFAFAGKGLSETNANNLTTRFEALMDANGKGVIV